MLPAVYLLLLALSHFWQWHAGERKSRGPDDPDQLVVQVPAFTGDGVAAAPPMRLAYHDWPAANVPVGDGESRPPVVLIHGSPGAGKDFEKIATRLAASGYRVIAPDLPGFGDSEAFPPDYSTRAHARSVIELLEQLGIERFHLVGWSLGGGVILQAVDLLDEQGLRTSEAADRVASMTLLAAVGRQRNEGSGSYAFEHAKYAAGMVVLGYGGELIPHFGLLGRFQFRHALLRNFADTDFRLNDAVIDRLTIPTLILHGREDFLIPARAAIDHYESIQFARLVMLDASHFIPFLQAEEATSILTEFFARHDRPGVDPERSFIDRSGGPKGSERLLWFLDEAMARAGWGWEAAFIGVLTCIAPGLGVAAAALLVDATHVDFFVGIVGLWLGWLVRTLRAWRSGRAAALNASGSDVIDIKGRAFSRSDWMRRLSHQVPGLMWKSQFAPLLERDVSTAVGLTGRGTIWLLLVRPPAIVAWSLIAMIPAVILFPLLVEPTRRVLGLVGVLMLIKMVASISCLVPMLLHTRGRQELRRRVDRIVHHEYWPAAVFYLPLVPLLYPLVRRLGGIGDALMHPTALNPAIENAGGLVGESKYRIMEHLREAGERTGLTDLVCPTGIVRRSGSAVADLDALNAEIDRLGLRYPIVLKPDAGQRGFGVKIVSDPDTAARHLAALDGDILVQPLIAAPAEIGIVWARAIPPRSEDRVGFIFSITAKEFPVVVGDGERTLEELLWSHTRFRRQAPTFEHRLADRRSWIPPAGQPVSLGFAGNHSQGTLFRDGAELHSPELERVLDRLLSNFAPSVPGGGLDIGRIDLRFTSADELRAGRGFSILELNGIFGESTNIYDPERSAWWAYGVLCRQWELLYTLGAWRVAQGSPRMSLWALLRMVRRYYAARRGTEVAD